MCTYLAVALVSSTEWIGRSARSCANNWYAPILVEIEYTQRSCLASDHRPQLPLPPAVELDRHK